MPARGNAKCASEATKAAFDAVEVRSIAHTRLLGIITGSADPLKPSGAHPVLISGGDLLPSASFVWS